ncbi:hypothetical protein ABVT39_001478 [Epinephelus coioides]
MADRERLSEAVGLLNNILNSSTVVKTMSEMLDQSRQPSTGASANAAVEEEMRRIFRAGSSGASGSVSGTSSGANVNVNANVSQMMRPRYQTQQYFGGWASKSRRRPTAPNHPTFNKDVILLPNSTWDEVCKHKTKRRLHESGYILSAFEMRKMWDCRTVIAEIREAFKDRIPVDVSIELLMACGNKLVSPKLREGQELNAFMIHKVFKSKAVYIRPSSNLPFPFDSTDSEDSCVEVDTTSASSDHRTTTASETSNCMTTRARGNQIASTQQISSYPCTRRARANQPSATQQATNDTMARANQPSATQQATSDTMARANQPSATQQATSDTMARANQPSATQQATSDTMARANQPSATQQATSVIDLDSVATVNQTPSASNDDYAAYLSIMGSISDLSSDDDDELNQAIMASLESHAESQHQNTKSAQEVLLNLASQIDSNQRCRFNINRSSVLDGALRGFRRMSYNPRYQMCIKFSDELGMDEEAVDLGGPWREFLRLLMEALALSPMFEGRDGKLNLALDSSALREDRYFIAGRAIAASLVHGGPPPGFIAPTLYSRLVGANSSKPVLEDIADTELYEKVKKVSECTSLDDLIDATEPLQDYLANAGCLKPLKCIDDKDLLVQDILMFQVVHRVYGAFERFREGLKTLGVLDAIRMHPDSFRPLMCHEPSPLTADLMDHLFHIRLSAVGSNKRRAEEHVVPFWRDYLQDVEGKYCC